MFTFGDYELDEGRFELRHRARVVAIQPKALELLLHLVRNRGRVLGKPEILAAVWPEATVTHGSLARAVSLAREAIGDRGRKPPAIVTVARRGYRFEAPVVERAEPSPEPPPDGAGVAPYVGRTALIARLSERLERALAGQGRILLLAGEAGIGKTRTAELLLTRARRAGALVAEAAGADEGSPPLWSWAQVLRTLAPLAPEAVGALGPAKRHALAPLLPELGDAAAEALGDVAPGALRDVSAGALGDEARRLALRDAVATFLSGASRAGPVVLLLEDLHAADVETLGLLEALGHGLATRPLAILATCREDDAGSPPRQARALERLLRLTTLERWPLGPLDPPEVREFVRAQLGGDAGAALCQAIEEQTGGNPLLMAESLRSLEARGLLGALRTAREWQALLPRGVRHLLLPKLRGLSAGAREVLATAAALGRETDRRTLAACLPDSASFEAALGESLDATLLLPGGDADLVGFSHALVREALYAELLPDGPKRRVVHARISELLERSAKGEEDALAERAHHACEAVPLVPPARAVELARHAGEQAARQLDFEGAADWFERALSRQTDGDRVLRVSLRLALGEAQTRALGLERARPSLREAADEARALGRSDLLAAAALGFAHRPSSAGSADAEVVALLEEAQQELPADTDLGIRLRSRLAVELRYDDLPRAERLMEAVVEAARRSGDPRTLAQALDDSTFVRWSPADSGAWIALNDEVARVAAACGDLELVVSGQRGMATGWLELGERAALEREIRALARTAETLRTSQARWLRTALEAMVSLLDGDLEPSEARVVEAMAHGERLESQEVALEVGVQLAYLRLEQGRAGETVDAVRGQLVRFPANTAWRAALAVLLLAADASAEAGKELQLLARLRFEDVPRDRSYLPTLAMAAGVAFALGDASAARSVAARLAPYARLHVVAGSGVLYYGAVSHALGLAAATCGRDDEAVEHLEAALASEEAMGAQLWAARARVDCARVLLARGAAHERARAANLLEEALGAARSRGWVEVARAGREVESELWKGRGSSSRSPRVRRRSRPSDS